MAKPDPQDLHRLFYIEKLLEASYQSDPKYLEVARRVIYAIKQVQLRYRKKATNTMIISVLEDLVRTARADNDPCQCEILKFHLDEANRIAGHPHGG